MKKCPRCGTQYSDDSLSFCLQDGTPLLGLDPETATLVIGDTQAAQTRNDAVRVPVGDPTTNKLSDGPFTRAAPPIVEKKGSSVALAVVATAVGMLVLFGIIALAVIFFYRNSQVAGIQNAPVSPATNPGGASPATSPPAAPATSVSPARKTGQSSPTTSPGSVPDTPPAPPVLSSYPPTSRLKFAPGSYNTSFAGNINPGDNRSLVLSCRSGQSLSANVSSGSGCVAFREGGSSFRTTTSGGDNYLTVTNHCSSVVRFSVSITII